MIITTNKRHKNSSPTNDEMKQDIISNFPLELLIKILSMLPPFDAKQTRILSNRWKNLYAFLPNLYFVMRYDAVVNKFYDFVDRTLAIRGDIPIQTFYLNCENKCDYDRVYDLLCTLVGQFKVQQLILIFPMDGYKVRFCWDLFMTCETLVELTLVGYFVLDVPEYEVLFPCLKKIELVSVIYSGDHSLTNLVSGCPVLDELCVERSVLWDRLVTFKVSSVSLKRLRINFTKFLSGDYKVVVDAPNLEYLYVYDNMTNHYSLTNSLSLVEADIYHAAETIPEIIPFLSSVKTLKLTCHASLDLDLEDVDGLNLPMFPNLVRLVTGWGLNMLPVLLNNMPNLEHITLLYGEEPLIVEWNPPAEPPVCLRFKMKEIIIHSEEAVSHKNFTLDQEEFALLRYLLKHSDILETLRINARKIDPEKREKLLNFHRGSGRCQIEFI